MEEEKTGEGTAAAETTAAQTAAAETADARTEPDGQDERYRFIARNVGEFRAQFPDVDIVQLEASPAFQRFCGSRLYREPLTELYADYREVTEQLRQAETSRADDRRQRSTGSGAGNPGDGLTGAQQQELEAWNRAFPQMRMTAKEFLKR